MGLDRKTVQQGFSTASSPLMLDLFLQDTRRLEPALQAAGNFLPGAKKIPLSRYYDPSFVAQEMEAVWKKCWQVQSTPFGSDPNECMMEVRLTPPVPASGPRPPAAELVDIDFDLPIVTVPAMGMMA